MTETKVNNADLSGIRCLFILMVQLYCPTLRPIQVQTDKMYRPNGNVHGSQSRSSENISSDLL